MDQLLRLQQFAENLQGLGVDSMKLFDHAEVGAAQILPAVDPRHSKRPTDITADAIRKVALPRGLVDVKVCAINPTWSGLKCVIRKELRGAPA